MTRKRFHGKQTYMGIFWAVPKPSKIQSLENQQLLDRNSPLQKFNHTEILLQKFRISVFP